MKKYFLIIPAICVLIGCLWLWSRKQTHPSRELNESQVSLKASTTPSQTEPLQPWSTDTTAPGANTPTIPASMRGATTDPAVVELVNNTQHKAEVGKIIVKEKGKQQLWEGTRLIFEAQRIGSDRTQADNGTIALVAVTGSQTPLDEAEAKIENGVSKLVGSPSEIWLVSSAGIKTKISPPNMDTSAPVIAPNGKTIAFAGRLLDDKGFPAAQRLYVGDIAGGQFRVFGDDAHRDNYEVWPVDWVENGSVLRVLQDYGETGGHMKLMKVHLE